ncbi:four helix bundle protein [bacterium]|nr:four helix bundle protein [candidate division CSSED10-310 bacterium]
MAVANEYLKLKSWRFLKKNEYRQSGTLQSETEGKLIPKPESSLRSYRKIVLWQRAVELVRTVFGVLSHCPSNVFAEIQEHIKKTAMSIPTQIAEGYVSGQQVFIDFMIKKTQSSLAKLDTEIHLAMQLKVISHDDKRRMEIIILELMQLSAQNKQLIN